jgi:outer membrane receptor protein involved in Fe transport
MLKIILSFTLFLISVFTTIIYGQNSVSGPSSGNESNLLAKNEIVTNGTLTITGTVLSEKNEIVKEGIVNLFRSTDHKLVKTEFTNNDSKFLFENVSEGSYYVTVSENGKTKYTGSSFDVSANLELSTIVLALETSDLKEVVIKKAKPYIERKDGKTIVNVENGITDAGTSAFEVLEKAPGVKIDASDNISLQGKSGVLVQINGKPTPLSGENLTSYLKGIASASIEKIEFITNPSSKYDAAGSSIINIIMKKGKKEGTNGSVSGSYGQGQYPTATTNLSLNHRNDKINVFGTYNFAHREGFNNLVLTRNFYENNVFSGAYSQDNYINRISDNHNLRAGIDYQLNNKHTLGLTVNNVKTYSEGIGKNGSDVYDATHTKSSRYETDNISNRKFDNPSINLNHKYVIDTLGTELTTDFDYARYKTDAIQNLKTKFYGLSDVEIKSPDILYGDTKGKLNIYSLKSDYVTTLKNGAKFESGIKTSFVKADNNLAFYDLSSGEPIYDNTKSNHFIYKENINAAYFNAAKEFGKWKATFGLRAENTNTHGEQLVDNTITKGSYTQLFPSTNVGYTFNEKHTLEINYSRRISRPTYNQLNPFKYYIDQTTYVEGNPYLKPQTTNSMELIYGLNQKIYTTLNFSRTYDNVTDLIIPSETDKGKTVQTFKNLDIADNYGFNIVVPVEVTKWFSTNNNFNFYYGSYSGTVSNTTLEKVGGLSYNINSTNSFKIAKTFSAEMTGNYQAKQVYAFMTIKPVWFLNIGFQKKFENKSSLKLAFNDVFATNYIQATSVFSNYNESFVVKRDSRVVILTYTYNFGNGKAVARRKTGGADDEKARANSSNG